MLYKLLTRVIPEKKIFNLILAGLDGQVISGYGFSVTLHFPVEKREEIMREFLAA